MREDIRLIAEKFIDSLKETFKERVDNISLFNVVEVPAHAGFSITFRLYDYYNMRFNYDGGLFGVCISYCEIGIEIPSSYRRYRNVDFRGFWNEVDEDIRLRIPDKYLEKKGWI